MEIAMTTPRLKEGRFLWAIRMSECRNVLN